MRETEMVFVPITTGGIGAGELGLGSAGAGAGELGLGSAGAGTGLSLDSGAGADAGGSIIGSADGIGEAMPPNEVLLGAGSAG